MSSARTNAERREYFRKEQEGLQRAEAKTRQEQEEQSRPRREAESTFAAVAEQQAEEFKQMISSQALDPDYLKSQGFVLGEQKVDAAYEEAAYRFKLATPSYNPNDAEHQKTLGEFLHRNDCVRLDIPSNFAHAWSLLLEWGVVSPADLPATPVETAVAVPEPRPSELAAKRLNAYHTEIVATDWNGQQYTEAELDALPDAKLALKIRRYEESNHAHSGNEMYSEFLERTDIIAQMKSQLSAEVPLHPGAENGGN